MALVILVEPEVFKIYSHIFDPIESFYLCASEFSAKVTIRYSKRMKERHLSIVKSPGRNSAIVIIAKFLKCIYLMLTKNIGFENNIDFLTRRKKQDKSKMEKYPRRFKNYEEVEKIFFKKTDQHKTDQPFSL